MIERKDYSMFDIVVGLLKKGKIDKIDLYGFIDLM